jgi:hypothetical protein
LDCFPGLYKNVIPAIRGSHKPDGVDTE